MDSTKKKMIKFVCMSDSHTKHRAANVPDGDIFIHCGDFTWDGEESEIKDFNNFLKELPHDYKIVIAGNHEITLDQKKNNKSGRLKNQLKENCIYLENSMVSIYGYNIYGSPYSIEIPKTKWGFMKTEKELAQVWDLIPDTADIVLTHGPPFGILDFVFDEDEEEHGGSLSLKKAILDRVKPLYDLYHIFGHVHEGYGLVKQKEQPS